MSRIKLKQLLNLTEQAPQPPMGDPLAPAPAPVAPPAGMNAGQPDQQTPSPAPSNSPEPEDPGEYDFTKDFRAFEDKKNKAEADAKKVLLDKMNERLLGKTIVANASRGYGQPKTDYTIKAVKKVSVEFWYKDYVVIVSDENDKKYFLTPGINIKIESEGSEPAPGAEPQAPNAVGAEQPQADQNQSDDAAGGQELPNGTSATTPQEEPEGEPQGVQPQATPEPAPAAQPKPQPQAEPNQPEAEPQAPQVPQTTPTPPKKKKKQLPVAEWVQSDLNKFLLEFMSNDIKNKNGQVNFVTYIKETSKMLSEGVDATKFKVKLLIPENHMVKVDGRDIKLAAVDAMRQKSHFGQYSKGSVDINKIGRYYLLEYTKEIGWTA
jgi:hypothetical protein